LLSKVWLAESTQKALRASLISRTDADIHRCGRYQPPFPDELTGSI
jgi:hypothetical protein